MKFYDESKLDLNTDMKVTGVVSLGSKSSATVTQGRNKCNKPWKKSSSRSGLSVPLAKKTWDKKIEEKREMKTLRDRVAALKEKRNAEKRAQHVRTKERAERKKLNEMKSSSFQVVSNFVVVTIEDRKTSKDKKVECESTQNSTKITSRDVLCSQQ